uniref:Uncharacterized protein n=1 Tax=Tanacetum cinerariifolium TaxID=118510 RepID=A0A6L2MYA0_TANCI|nr:hypothetical protein [Tanacetum cinerariifolium]
MRADELYKLSDGTLKIVRDELHQRIPDFHLGCNDEISRRKWADIEKKRSELMVELVDKQIRKRQNIRNLERLIDDRELEMDYKLMTRTRRREEDDDQEGPSAGSDWGSKRRREGGEHASASTPSEPATGSAGSALAKQIDARSSFNELLDTPIDFSDFIMNWLGGDTLTPDLLDGPTYELMRGSCNSLTELEYHLEEVYKATTDQLDLVNPEGDLKRLRLQDIKDMLLLLVQGKLSNLTVKERFAFNVSIRMFTRSIVIQRRVEDLQLGVESYQKRLNLKKLDTYQSDLKRREAYTAYLNPRGFIYQNKDKKNRLMRIDELYKFSDGTLNNVRNALDDRLKGIRMKYLPTTIWRIGDKDRAVAMIQAIDKMLKTRRIIRSLERFVGGRQYEGDFQMLQRTI